MEAYAQGPAAAYHMPGHKRAGLGLPPALAALDITEIEGFDNLHQAVGCLREAMDRAAALYGAAKSYYLVGGSSAGLLAAISALAPRGGKILLDRGCHKSVYHAMYLRGLEPVYLWPRAMEGQEYIREALGPEALAGALEAHGDARLAVITHPTYEGRLADIRAMAELAHARGVALVVDEAHGAHLGFHPAWGASALSQGADVVIQSVHKTLPALTQSALLHLSSTEPWTERIEHFLRIYQSTSPSYLLMASIDSALSYVEEQGERAFGEFARLWEEMAQALASCRHLAFPGLGEAAQDRGKLLISTRKTHLSGKRFYDMLWNDYGLQLEMAGPDFALAMFTLADGEAAYGRLVRALLEIDARLEDAAPPSGLGSWWGLRPAGRMALEAAWDAPGRLVALARSAGRICARCITPYPPGVPLLAPGEEIDQAAIGVLEAYLGAGLWPQGLEGAAQAPLIPVV